MTKSGTHHMSRIQQQAYIRFGWLLETHPELLPVPIKTAES
jgi:hypothetical protein